MSRGRAAFHNLDPDTIVLRLKGAPLSILMVLWWFGGQGRDDLVARTGYSINTIKRDLARLERDGLVTRLHYRKWIVTPLFYQLPIPFGQLPAAPERSLTDLSGQKLVDNSVDGLAERSPSDLSGQSTDVLMGEVVNAERSPSDLSASQDPSERSPSDLSALYDHDHEHINTDEVVERLKSLKPSFKKAEYWLSFVDVGLVVEWLDYFDSFPPHERRQHFVNEAAYLNAMVRRGERAPHRESEIENTCAECGKSYFDGAGRCMVCDGRILL